GPLFDHHLVVHSPVYHPAPHSFPTRRSSDLARRGAARVAGPPPAPAGLAGVDPRPVHRRRQPRHRGCGPLSRRAGGRCRPRCRCAGTGGREPYPPRAAAPDRAGPRRPVRSGAWAPLRPGPVQSPVRQRSVDAGIATRIPRGAGIRAGWRRRRHGPGAPAAGAGTCAPDPRRGAAARDRPRGAALRGGIPGARVPLPAGRRRRSDAGADRGPTACRSRRACPPRRPRQLAKRRASPAGPPPVIRLHGLTLSGGGRVLLDRVDATIGPGERIALIGQNGTGKTTLLSALAGELPPDAGDIVQPWRDVIRLEQALPSSALPAWRFIVASDARLEAARHEIERAERDGDGTALAHAHDHWHEAGGLSAEARCRALLAGLGFDAEQAGQPV